MKPEGVAKPFLVEFLPINWHESFFEGQDLDPSYTRSGQGQNGRPAIHYMMRTERQDAYANWSGRRARISAARSS